MPSNLVQKPFLSTFAKKWKGSRDSQKYWSKPVAAADEVRQPQVERLPVCEREDQSEIHAEGREFERPRLLRRESGSAFFHWGVDDLSTGKDSILEQFSAEDQDNRSAAHFGFKPAFLTNSDGDLLMQNCQNLVNGYLRELSLQLETQNVVLNKNGGCHFYYHQFLLSLDVPQHGGMITMSTVVHRRLNNNSDDKASQESSEYSFYGIPQDSEVKKHLPTEMTLEVKRGHQVILSYPQQVPGTFKEFAQELQNFVHAARDIKVRLKRRDSWVEI